MKNSCLWFLLIFGIIVLTGNVIMLFFFSGTSVGLSPMELDMLGMTSNQINGMYGQACAFVVQLEGLQNVTTNLTMLSDELVVLTSVHDANVRTANILANTSHVQEERVIAYNSTIEQLFNAHVQTKIDNTTIPTTLNLTIFDNTTTIFNGTVLLANPNNLAENVNLTYIVKEQLNTTYIELGPVGAKFEYSTIGAMNYVTLINWDPPLFADNTGTFTGFTFGQVLDSQRDKIQSKPPIGSREYVASAPGVQEIRLHFDGVLSWVQNITLAETVEINVGFI